MFSFQSTLPIHVKVFFLLSYFSRFFFYDFLSKNVRIDGAILFLFVFITVNSNRSIKVHWFITMASASQYDSRRHGDMAEARQYFVILTL